MERTVVHLPSPEGVEKPLTEFLRAGAHYPVPVLSRDRRGIGRAQAPRGLEKRGHGPEVFP